MLTEGGQIQDVPTFEDDQGINVDDEEAKEVEQGELCKPGASAARSKMPPPDLMNSDGPKRSASARSSQEAKSKPKKAKLTTAAG